MAQKKPSRKPSANNPAFRGFVNINLTDEDKAIIKSTKYDLSDYVTDLDKWIDNGFKFTFSADDYNHCFQVVSARQDREHEDAGILMSGRGSTAIKAFKQWIYIQTRLVGESTWSELLSPVNKYELDD